MNTDLIGSVELTASAAIVIAALSIGFSSNATTRARIAVSLSLWFVLVVILAATRALYYEHGIGAPGVGIAVRRRIGRDCLARCSAAGLRRSQLGHHDISAVDLHVRFFGAAAVYGSHRYCRSAGECQEAGTLVRLDRNELGPGIVRVARRMSI